MPKTGDRRFQCRCGEIWADGIHVMTHITRGHEVVMERYSLGFWQYSRTVMMEAIVEMLAEQGADVPVLIANLERYGNELEAQARGLN